MKKIIALLTLGCFLSPLQAFALTAAQQETFEAANAHYRKAQYGEAAVRYQQLVSAGVENATVFYNLANASYRTGALGKAILNYERAKLLSPRDRDVLENLGYVNEQVQYRVEDKRNWYLRAGEDFLQKWTVREIRILCLGLWFFFLLSWLLILFFRPQTGWTDFRKFLLILCLVSSALVGLKHVEVQMMKDAILMDKEVEFRYGPSESDQVAFRLSEGVKVQILDSREGWSRVLLVNDESGWVKDSQIQKVSLEKR